jgi:hypothetical protein
VLCVATQVIVHAKDDPSIQIQSMKFIHVFERSLAELMGSNDTVDLAISTLTGFAADAKQQVASTTFTAAIHRIREFLRGSDAKFLDIA